MKFVFVSSQVSWSEENCAWRGFRLASAIRNTHHSTASTIPINKVLRPGLTETAICAAADLIIVEADPDPAVLAAIQHLKTLNKTVLLDIAPKEQILSSNPSLPRPAARENPEEKSTIGITEAVQWQMRLVDGVILHSTRMLEDIHGLANGIVIPEYIELDKYSTLCKMPHDGIVLGLSNQTFDPEAGLNSGLLAALSHIVHIRPGTHIEILGRDPSLTGFTDMPSATVHFSPGPGAEIWPAPLSHIDIGLAPLSGELDQRRGWENVLEFMAMKIPWVASQGPAYLELRPYGWIVENNASTWERVLLDIIDHLSAYGEEAGGEPYLFAISQGIEENIEWILNRFAEVLNFHSTVRQK